jgi:hypothetical protein
MGDSTFRLEAGAPGGHLQVEQLVGAVAASKKTKKSGDAEARMGSGSAHWSEPIVSPPGLKDSGIILRPSCEWCRLKRETVHLLPSRLTLEVGYPIKAAGRGASLGTLDNNGDDISAMPLRLLGRLLLLRCQ